MKSRKTSSILILILFTVILTGCVSVKFNKEKEQSEEKEGSGFSKMIEEVTEDIKKEISKPQNDMDINLDEYRKQQEFKFNKTEYRINEEIKGYNFIFVVKDINNYQEPENSWLPAEGNKHVALNVVIKNTGQGLLDYNRSNYTLTDADGRQYKIVYTTSHEHALGYSYLLPGKEINAYLIFEVAEDASEYILKYQALNGQVLKIKL